MTPTRLLTNLSLLIGAAVGAAAGGQDLAHSWTRTFLPEAGSYTFRSACASPSGRLLVVVAEEPPRPEPIQHVAMVLDAQGNVLERVEPTVPGEGRIADIPACIATKDGYVLTARAPNGGLVALWLTDDLQPNGALSLTGKEYAQVWALTADDDGRIVAALDVDYSPSLLWFDRKSVVQARPKWSPDKARLLYDVAIMDGSVVVCGMEGDRGDDPDDPSFANVQVLVASFGKDGVERNAVRLPGRTCRLFSEGPAGVALLHPDSNDPRSGLRVTRLDSSLSEREHRSALDRLAFLFKLEAEVVGQSFVVLRGELTGSTLDIVEPAGSRSVRLDAGIERPVALRAVGDSVFVLSFDVRDSGVTGLRVDSFGPAR